MKKKPKTPRLDCMGRTKADIKRICDRADFLGDLLKKNGASLCGFDPGVTAYLPNSARGEGYFGETLNFNSAEWRWLEPLLVELVALRESKSTGGA